MNTRTGVFAQLIHCRNATPDGTPNPATAWLEDPKHLMRALVREIEDRPDCWDAPMICIKDDITPCCENADDDHDDDPDAWVDFSHSASTTTRADYNDPGRWWL